MRSIVLALELGLRASAMVNHVVVLNRADRVLFVIPKTDPVAGYEHIKGSQETHAHISVDLIARRVVDEYRAMLKRPRVKDDAACDHFRANLLPIHSELCNALLSSRALC